MTKTEHFSFQPIFCAIYSDDLSYCFNSVALTKSCGCALSDHKVDSKTNITFWCGWLS